MPLYKLYGIKAGHHQVYISYGVNCKNAAYIAILCTSVAILSTQLITELIGGNLKTKK